MRRSRVRVVRSGASLDFGEELLGLEDEGVGGHMKRMAEGFF